MRPVRFVVENIFTDNTLSYYKVYRHTEDIFKDMNSRYGAIFVSYTICHNNYGAGHLTVGDSSLLLGIF